jgi:hypothetical protein
MVKRQGDDMTQLLLFALLLGDASGPAGGPIRFPVSPEDMAQVFFQVLSEHGEWLVTDGSGLAWRPAAGEVGEGFVPFATGGVWMRGPEGWQFESRYSWGGIVFRYGTWLQDFDQRWVWIPGARKAHRGTLAYPPDMHYRVENDTRFAPPFVRVIQYPAGTQFAYPLGQGFGRQFPEGTEVRWAPGFIGAAKDHMVLVPEESLHAPNLRVQSFQAR